MPNVADRKLYLGPRLRTLRRQLGLNQTRMADELGVSPSYLNHLERNQRPLTAQMLLRLAGTYDIDVRDFVASDGEAATGALQAAFADPLVSDIGVGRQEAIELAESHPGVAEAVVRLHRALADLRRLPDRIERASAGAAAMAPPMHWLRAMLDERRNHFAELDAAAEALSSELGEGPEALRQAMLIRLSKAHGITVRVVPQDALAGTLRHYDFHRRRLMLSERLPPPSRLFGIAYQLALHGLPDAIADTVADAGPPDEEARALARVALADYAAAAIVMPYARFQRAADAHRHDIDLLAQRFGASYEQVAHRLTTLGRADAPGVPFFMLKIDAAGNVSKRFSAGALALGRLGGGCPRWRIHRTFRLPGETIAELVETPDGARLLSVARAIPRVGGEGLAAIVLGCEASHAARIGYADQLPAEPTPIGPACPLCERPDCPERALPPIARALELNLYQRPIAPYPFRAT